MASPSKRQKLEPRPQFQPLTCVRVVCRERPFILDIDHVVAALDAFLDWSPQCTVAKACALCSSHLLQRVLARDAREPANSVKSDPRYHQWQFERGMATAIVLGNLELAKGLGTHFRHCTVRWEDVVNAASHGRLGILEWLYVHRQDVKPLSRDVEYALKGNHFEVAKWLGRKVPPSDRMPLSWLEVAAWSSLEMVKWAYGQISGTISLSKTESMVAAAVDAGHLDILVWLFENVCGDRPCFSVSLSTAVRHGHVNVIEWMVRNQRAVCRSLHRLDMTDAARDGKLSILRLLHAYKVDSRSAYAMDYAARNGHLDAVKWLHATNVSGCTSLAMDYASERGFLDVVKWLHENRSEGCSVLAMDRAAAGGHMEVLQWLAANRSEGCSSEAMDNAACNGHLTIVQWIHNNRTEGCTVRAMNRAAMNGHLEVVKWLHVHRTEGCTVDAMNSAAGNGHLTTVKWLHINRTEGCTVHAMNQAAENGHLEVVQWLHVNRSEGCTTYAMDWAAVNGHLEVVKWLHANRTERYASSAICGAVFSDKMEVALFLHCEREECDLTTAVRRYPWKCWEVVDWVYCHCPPDLASSIVATLGTEC